jgi:hypothetical protein
LRSVRDTLEAQQIALYFTAVVAAALIALALPGVAALEAVINPTLAVMLFATFLRVPLAVPVDRGASVRAPWNADRSADRLDRCIGLRTRRRPCLPGAQITKRTSWGSA